MKPLKPDTSETIMIIDDEPLGGAAEVLPLIDETSEGDSKLPPHAVRNDNGSVTLPLLHPQELRFRNSSGAERSESYKELTLHRLNGGDLIAIGNQAEGSRAWFAIARSARMAPNKMKVLFERMDGVDCKACGDVVSFFLDAGQTTGR